LADEALGSASLLAVASAAHPSLQHFSDLTEAAAAQTLQ